MEISKSSGEKDPTPQYDNACGGQIPFNDEDYDHISELYAQEIEENLINENREANLSRIIASEKFGSGTENFHKRKVMDSVQPNWSRNINPGLGAIPKSAFSYLNDTNFSINRSALPLLKKENSGEFFHLLRNKSKNVVSNDSSNNDAVPNVGKQVPGKLGSKAFAFLQKSNSLKFEQSPTEDIDKKNKIEQTNPQDIIPPLPLPARPPPIFRYPLGTFALISNYPHDSVLSDTFKGTEQPIADAIDKKISINQLNLAESPRENFNDTSHDNIIEKALPDMMNPCSISTIPSRKISEPINFFPIVNQLNEKSRLNEVNNESKNSDIFFNQSKIKPTIPPRLDTNLKPKISKKPERSLVQRFEHLIDERNREREIFNRKFESVFDKKLPEIPKRKVSSNINRDNVDLTDNMEKKTSFNDCSALKSAKDEKISLTFSNSSNSKVKISETKLPLKAPNGQSKIEANKPNLIDFDALQNAMNRPTLPQKLKTPQRSVSCNSLVQTFKDISMSIWSPPDKNKRSSIGILPSNVTKNDIKIGNNDTSILMSSPTISDNLNIEENEIVLDNGKCLSENTKVNMKHNEIEHNLWFHNVDAFQAQQRLLNLDDDGAFLVRPSTRPTQDIHYTVSVVHKGRVFNIHIRRKLNQKYALGKEKQGEKSFTSILELIRYYQDVPFDIRPSGCNEKFGVRFRVTPPR